MIADPLRKFLPVLRGSPGVPGRLPESKHLRVKSTILVLSIGSDNSSDPSLQAPRNSRHHGGGLLAPEALQTPHKAVSSRHMIRGLRPIFVRR